MSVSKFIDAINEHVKTLLDTWPGAKLHGLCQSVVRRSGSEYELLPAEVTKNGEMIYVGIDDTAPIIIYHKCENITFAAVKGGYGDSPGDNINNYQNSMIVYMDRSITKLLPEELLLYVQANFPTNLKASPYISNHIKFTGVVLNTRAVFEKEYKGSEFKLPAEKSLFQINYSIESRFRKDCFEKCPC